MKIINKFLLAGLGVMMVVGCKARQEPGSSSLRDSTATGGSGTYTNVYPGSFVQDVPNEDISGEAGNGNPDVNFGRFILTFNHDNETDSNLDDQDGAGSREQVRAFGVIKNAGKQLVLSMGHSVNIVGGGTQTEWRGNWPCQDAFAMVEEQNLPAWAQNETANCVVGFIGDNVISAATREGTFRFGISAN